jgi:thioredoxin 1
MAANITDQSFKQDVTDFDGVAVVDFWAEWCGPCRVQGPIVDALSQKFAGNAKVKFGKLDVDNNPATQSQFHVMSIPTLIFYKKGEVAETFVGLRSQDDIEARLNELLEE